MGQPLPESEDCSGKYAGTRYQKALEDLNLKISCIEFRLMVVVFYTLLNTVGFLAAALSITALRQEAQRPV